MPPVNSDTVPQLLKSMSSCIQLTLHDGGRTETNGSACSAPRPPDAPPGPAAGAATVRKPLSDLGPLLTHSPFNYVTSTINGLFLFEKRTHRLIHGEDWEFCKLEFNFMALQPCVHKNHLQSLFECRVLSPSPGFQGRGAGRGLGVCFLRKYSV